MSILVQAIGPGVRRAILDLLKKLVKVALYLKILDAPFEFSQLVQSHLYVQVLLFLPLY
jgi:hypothetical protein